MKKFTRAMARIFECCSEPGSYCDPHTTLKPPQAFQHFSISAFQSLRRSAKQWGSERTDST